MLRGTLTTFRRRCGKPACRCATGEPHESPALPYTEAGRTKTLTLSPAEVAEVRAALARYEESLQSFIPLFRIGRKVSPQGDELPATLEETIIGGVFWIIYQRIILGETEQIEQLLPELVEFALTPFIGADAARRASA